MKRFVTKIMPDPIKGIIEITVTDPYTRKSKTDKSVDLKFLSLSGEITIRQMITKLEKELEEDENNSDKR